MGLDQYGLAGKDEKSAERIACWRKHNRLQGWMENLWRSKGGEGEFNCVVVELTRDDLDALESAVKTRTLPPTSGFFFGEDSYLDDSSLPYYDYKEDRAFIKKAKAALRSGQKVYYGSWW